MSWTLSVWEKSLPVYEAILAQPFIKELADGSLSAERFSRYIAQDELYLGTYGRQMFQIAGLLADPSEREMFTAFAQSGIDGEKAMHQLLCIQMASINQYFWMERCKAERPGSATA